MPLLPVNSPRSRAPVFHWPKLTGCIPWELTQGFLLSKLWPEDDLLYLLATGDAMVMARAATP